MRMTKVLVRQTDQLKELVTASGKGNTARFGYVDFDGKAAMYQCGACHAGIDRFKRTRVVINGVQCWAAFHTLGKKVQLKFIDWMINRSPWETAFHSDDAELVLKEELTVHNTNADGALMASSCIAMRYMWEHSHIARKWYDLVEAGCPEDIAILLAHYIAGDKGGAGRFTDQHVSHCCLYPSKYSVDAIRRFIRHKHVGVGGTFRTKPTLYGSSYCWTGRERKYDEIGQWNVQVLQAAQKKKAKKVLGCNNPFAQKKGLQLRYEDYIRGAAIVGAAFTKDTLRNRKG